MGPTGRAPRNQVASNGLLGMLLFVMAEAMLFAGMISAFTIVRSGALVWPPPGQPRLPIEATAFNTLVLLASGCATSNDPMYVGLACNLDGGVGQLLRYCSKFQESGDLVTAAAEDPPGPLLAQLAIGGIMVLPVGQSDTVQSLIRVTRLETGFDYDELVPVRFVPLLEGIGQD